MEPTRHASPRVAFVPLLALGASACATAPEPPAELLQARSAYNAAQESEAWSYDRAGLNRASSALAKAEVSFNKEGDSAGTREDAEAALRRAQQAQFEGAVTARAHAEIDRAITERLAVAASDFESESEASPAPAQPARKATVSLAVALFPSGQSSLPTEARETLDQFAGKLIGRADASVHIRGHADSTGSERRNMDLSRERANQVAEYLSSHGVAPEQMVVDAVGDSQPLATAPATGADAINRRVLLVAYAPAERAPEAESPEAP